MLPGRAGARWLAAWLPPCRPPAAHTHTHTHSQSSSTPISNVAYYARSSAELPRQPGQQYSPASAAEHSLDPSPPSSSLSTSEYSEELAASSSPSSRPSSSPSSPGACLVASSTKSSSRSPSPSALTANTQRHACQAQAEPTLERHDRAEARCHVMPRRGYQQTPSQAPPARQAGSHPARALTRIPQVIVLLHLSHQRLHLRQLALACSRQVGEQQA